MSVYVEKMFRSIEQGYAVDLKRTISNIERMAVFMALDKCNNDKAAAARLLGLKRTTLQMKIQRFRSLPDTDKVRQ